MSRRRRKRSDDHTVVLGGEERDLADTAERPAEEDAGAPRGTVDPDATGPEDTRLVQFTGPLTAADIERLRDTYGLALTAYISPHTYVERVAEGLRAALADDPAVRALAPYLPEYKLSPLLFDADLRTPDDVPEGKLRVDASLFDRGDPEAVKAAAEAMGADELLVLDDRPLGGSARVRFTVDADADLGRLAALDDVRSVEPVPAIVDDNVGAASAIQSGDAGDAAVWDMGLHGEGQVIGILDSSPVDLNHCFFADAAPNTPGAAHRKVVALRNATGTASTRHATFVAGCAAGDDRGDSGGHANRGGAWAAKLISGNRRDLSGTTLLAELTAAMNAGAFIHSNSWHDSAHGAGNPAPYNQNAVDVDTFTFNNEDHLVLGSSGNTGEEQGAPGTSKNAVCVSSAATDLTTLGDGNPGPTVEGRMKPDIVTVGCGISSAGVGTACGIIARGCATSWATPHAAAAAALVRQYFTEGWYPTGQKVDANALTPSGALMKAMLVASTVDMTGVPDYPNQTEGWGLVRLRRALVFAGDARSLAVFDVRHTTGPVTGDTRTHRVVVSESTEQLKVVMVFSDPAGPVNLPNTAVNDLDLVVTSPGGTVFAGNDFAGGVSVPDSLDPGDLIETVEVVVVNDPEPGTWMVDVEAFEVATGNPGQGYAVVAVSRLESRCFVSSAVYRDSEHPDVEALRDWRDRNLDRRAMRLMAAGYARIGPWAAALVRRMPRTRRVLRRSVLPRIARRARRGAG